jgi:hypothetical protein
MESNHQLFLLSCVVVLPFQNGLEIQKRAIALIQMIQSDEVAKHFAHLEQFQRLSTIVDQFKRKAHEFKLSHASLNTLGKLKFFQSPTKTALVNANNQVLNLHIHPLFGKRLTENPDSIASPVALLTNQPQTAPSLASVINFIQGFY